MNIELVYEPKKAKGTVIVIDVIRAATVAAYILNNNAKYLIPVKTKAEAINLKKKNSKYILLGEVDGYKGEGFDYGNSPSEIKDISFKDKVVVHRSSLGTAGLLSVPSAKEIIFGSFVTFSAIKKYLQQTRPSVVSLFPTGGYGSEDERFAFFLHKSIQGHPTDIEDERNYIKSLDSKFFNPIRTEFPEEDFHLSLTLDTFPFICLSDSINGQLIVRKQEV